MSKQTESIIAKDCLKLLDNLIANGHPIYYEHRSGGGGFSYKKGLPDLFIVVDGIHIECELKTPWGERSSMQEKWATKFALLNIKYMCPRSFVDFRDYILEILKN